MAKFKKSPKAHDGIVTSDIVQGGRGSNRRVKLAIIASLGVIVLLVAGLGSYVYVHNKRSHENKAPNTNIISPQTEKEVSDGLKSETGLSLSALESSDISNTTYNNFDQAYQSGLALYASGFYQKALQSFQYADTMPGTNYQFYIDYSAVESAVNNNQLSLVFLEKAKNMASADTTLSASDKQSLIDSINEQQATIRSSGT